MRKIMFVLFILAFGLSMTNSVVATAVEEADMPFTVELTLDGASKYLGTAGTVYEDNPVIQPSMTVEHISGVYATIWSSVGIQNEDGDELDYILGWSGDIGGGFTLNIGGGYWDFNKMFHGRTDNVWDIFVEVGYDFGIVEVYAKSDGMFMEPDSSFEGGFNQYLGLRREIEVEQVKGLTISGDAYLVYDDGVFGTQPCTSAQYRLGADYEVADGLTIGPRFAVSMPFDPNEDDGREREFVWGAGIAYTF